MAEAIASLMLIQIEKAQMPWPDVIVPVPHAPWHALLRGYHPTQLIAKALAKMMGVKMVKALKRSFVSLPQRSKTKEERMLMPAHAFTMTYEHLIADRSILLVDDVTTTGMTLQQCARVLKQAFPATISACTLTLVE